MVYRSWGACSANLIGVRRRPGQVATFVGLFARPLGCLLRQKPAIELRECTWRCFIGHSARDRDYRTAGSEISYHFHGPEIDRYTNIALPHRRPRIPLCERGKVGLSIMMNSLFELG